MRTWDLKAPINSAKFSNTATFSPLANQRKCKSWFFNIKSYITFSTSAPWCWIRKGYAIQHERDSDFSEKGKYRVQGIVTYFQVSMHHSLTVWSCVSCRLLAPQWEWGAVWNYFLAVFLWFFLAKTTKTYSIRFFQKIIFKNMFKRTFYFFIFFKLLKNKLIKQEQRNNAKHDLSNSIFMIMCLRLPLGSTWMLKKYR